MEIINLLELLNKTKNLYALEYATCNENCVDYLEFINWDEQFTTRFDLGLVFITQTTLNQVTIVDGLNRILSLSLLLHAICECYKKTSEKNDAAIKFIRSKYLLDETKTKLRLPVEDQKIYEKILFGERLSGREKESSLFVQFHNLWTKIKDEALLANDIFKVIEKLHVTLIETDDITQRDLYYNLNKDRREINQLLLIEDYLKQQDLKKDWDDIKRLYSYNKSDIELFFKDFFITKLNNTFQEKSLYYYFINYFDTMLKYITKDVLMQKIKKTAALYYDILNVSFTNENIKKAFIQIKIHGGEDTFAYLLSIYEDYKDENLTEATFLEILSTIDDYLKNRLKTPNNILFDDLIKYLNAFITCK